MTDSTASILVPEHWTSSTLSIGFSRVHWPKQSSCALWIWTRNTTVALEVSGGGCSGTWGCLIGVGVCFTLQALSMTCGQCMLDCGWAALCYRLCSLFSWRGMFRRYSQEQEGVRFGNHMIVSLFFLQMMSSCWLHWARTCIWEAVVFPQDRHAQSESKDHRCGTFLLLQRLKVMLFNWN